MASGEAAASTPASFFRSFSTLRQLVTAAWRYWRLPRRYPPGAGSAATGYRLLPQPHEPVRVEPADRRELLWDA